MITNLPDRIFLCGFMGAGKTTIGKVLAEKLEQSFMDLDQFIEHEQGLSIPEIFENEGEDAFRALERSAIRKAIRTFKGIIALGGGSLQDQHILDHIKLNGLLIFIETPFSVIFERIKNNTKRPLLLDDGGSPKSKDVLQAELKALYQQRMPLYEQAVIQIDSSKFDDVDSLSDKLIRKIKNHVSDH
ncbi:MAG: shikimate kinase [Balneolaceae bacterium]|nr:shikimate kinase [Balneolaceae bacterium]